MGVEYIGFNPFSLGVLYLCQIRTDSFLMNKQWIVVGWLGITLKFTVSTKAERWWQETAVK